MKLLYANDSSGVHANSWYHATADVPDYPSFEGVREYDVCIIGGGYTGLSAAITAASSGLSVCLLEAHRIGWGASGRNGGQLGSGFNRHGQLEKQFGGDASRDYWALATRAKRHVLDTCHKHNIDVQYVPGIVNTLHKKVSIADLQRETNAFNELHPGAEIEVLDKQGLQTHIQSDDYYAGIYESSSGHLHPLKLAIGLATVAKSSGADLFEKSAVTRVEKILTSEHRYRLHTDSGQVIAKSVVCAMNGYLDGLVPRAALDVIPINNFIIATEPLGDRITSLLPSNAAIADSRFVVNYFRRSLDNRLLFGGGENYGYRFPNNFTDRVRRAMSTVFPTLRDVRFDFAWGGTLAITRSRWPSVAELEPGLYCSSGYSGHGVALANYCGHAVGKAITGDYDDFQALARLPTGRIPGNSLIRPLMASAAMGGSALLDRVTRS